MCSHGNRVFLVLAFILSIISFQDANAAAAVLTLQPDGTAGKDAFITFHNVDSNYGDSEYLSLNHGEDFPVYSLIEFDISAIPAGAVITSATLELLEFNNCGENRNAIEIHLNDAAWEEGTVTWNNAPSFGSSYVNNSGDTSSCEWLIFDVTNAVQDWYDGTFSNYGFQMTGPSGERVFKYIRSSDYATAAERPILRVNYEGGLVPPPIESEPIPTMSVWGLGIFVALLGFIGFSRRRHI